MSTHSLTDLFAATADPPIERAALALARDAYPALNVAAYLAKLDELAKPLAARIPEGASPREQADAIAAYVYDELGFVGDSENYYDPRNSYLNEVIDRRRGIPITLATIVIALGTRAGLTVEGVGFPGHFLVRLGGTGGLLLDPFHRAKVMGESDLQSLARSATGDRGAIAPEHTAPVTARAMIVRMLTNLKGIYASRRDHARALVVCDRLVDLAGGPEQRRDRGVHASALGANNVAIADIDAYLTARPNAPDAPQLRTMLERARAQRRNSVQ